jgi:acyl-CoA reductase-like NAD-dependent aldehyde dehydrogenase
MKFWPSNFPVNKLLVAATTPASIVLKPASTLAAAAAAAAFCAAATVADGVLDTCSTGKPLGYPLYCHPRT